MYSSIFAPSGVLLGDSRVKGPRHQASHRRRHQGTRTSISNAKHFPMIGYALWTWAKHRVGLDRPHHLALCRGQNDPCVAPAQHNCESPGKWGEESKNCILQLRLHHFLHQELVYTIHPQRLSVRNRRETHCPRKTKSGGSDPTFSALSRPKSCWGHSRPIQGPWHFRANHRVQLFSCW